MVVNLCIDPVADLSTTSAGHNAQWDMLWETGTERLKMSLGHVPMPRWEGEGLHPQNLSFSLIPCQHCIKSLSKRKRVL